MDKLRESLNRLAMDFWCGVGDLDELSSWTDFDVMEYGEFHPLIWEFYPQPKSELITELLLTIAYEVNGLNPLPWQVRRLPPRRSRGY